MSDTYDFECVYVTNSNEMKQIQSFLACHELDIDSDVECFIVARDRLNTIIACGGIANNILKSIAIATVKQGEGLSLKLMTEMTNFCYELGRYDLYLYTKPENALLFRNAGFFPIAQVDDLMVLMENSPNRLSRYCQQLSLLRVKGRKIGAIVMNANPFTLGHQYLIETACKECDWVHLFVVKDESKGFSYEQRYKMIKLGCQDFNNITIHPGSDYLISKVTFPTYFIKDQLKINYCHTALDLTIFRQYIAAALGITHRYVGTEPQCAVTNYYNESMLYWLEQSPSQTAPIQVVQIARRVAGDEPISASRVRQLLATGQTEHIKSLVPYSTFQQLGLSDDFSKEQVSVA